MTYAPTIKLLYHKNLREYNPNLIQGIRGVSAAPILRGLSGDRRNFLDNDDIRAYTIKVYQVYQIIGLNGQLYNATDVIDTYVFRSLVTNPDIGMTSAATFYQSVLCFVIIMVVNAIVKRIDEDYALF